MAFSLTPTGHSDMLYTLNEAVAVAAGLMFNAILLFLIKNRTPAQVKAYSRILRVHCYADVTHAIVNGITSVQPISLNGKVFLISTHLSGYSTAFTRIVISTFLWTVMFEIALLPIDFYYRYMTLCRNKQLSNSKLYLLVAVAFFVPATHAFVFSWFYGVPGPTPETASESFELRKALNLVGDIPNYGVSNTEDVTIVMHYLFLISLVIGTYVVIIFYLVRIYATIRNNGVLRGSTRTKVEKQFTRVMIIQASLPFVVICLPTLLVTSFAILYVDLLMGRLIASVAIWLPVVKSAATIFTIPSYRNVILHPEMLSKPKPIHHTSSVVKARTVLPHFTYHTA